jgi:hypothetical protein
MMVRVIAGFKATVAMLCLLGLLVCGLLAWAGFERVERDFATLAVFGGESAGSGLKDFSHTSPGGPGRDK